MRHFVCVVLLVRASEFEPSLELVLEVYFDTLPENRVYVKNA